MTEILILSDFKDLFNSLFPDMMWKYTTFRNKRLMRVMSSFIPLANCPRIHFRLTAWSRDHLSQLPKKDQVHMDSLEKISSASNDTSIGQSLNDDKIQELVEKVNNLQQQVLALLEKDLQSSKEAEICRNCHHHSKEEKLTQTPPPPPPPPPPIPPPLPPMISSSTPLRRPAVKRKTIPRYCSDSTVEALAQVLSQISKGPPKLKHVERSPGGRPLKPKPFKIDPSNILESVLKKRFVALHSDCDSSVEKSEDVELSPSTFREAY